jgi:hypothetical protein
MKTSFLKLFDEEVMKSQPAFYWWSAVALLLVIAYTPAVAQEHRGYAEISQATIGAPRQVVLGDLPQVTAIQGALKPPEAPPMRTGLSEGQYKALKERALQRGGLAAPGVPEEAPPTVPGEANTSELLTPGTSRTFFPPNTLQQSVCGFIPSDMGLAANATFVVQVANGCITVLSATSGAPFTGFPKSLSKFFGLPEGDTIGDPRAIYDSLANRFIVIAEDFSTTPATLALAVSQSSNPTLDWNIYTLAMGSAGECGDFPTLGQTLNEAGDARGAIYVGFSVFSCASGAFLDNVVFFLPKTPIYAGVGFTFFFGFNFVAGGNAVDTIQPANVMNRTDRPRAEFMVNSFNINFGGGQCSSGCNGLVVWAVFGGVPLSGGSPSISGVVIPTANNYSFPADAVQPGCTSGSCLIDTGDTRISGGVNYSAGSISGTLNTGPGILLWEVHPTLDDAGAITTAQIRNEVCFGCGGFTGGGQAYYGTIQPDAEGNFTMVYNFSSAGTNNVFPGTAFLSRRVTQAQNTLRDSGFLLAAGRAFYQQLDRFGRNRWGDYTATAPSGLTPPSYWFSGMFSQAISSWGTAIGRNGYTAVTEP